MSSQTSSQSRRFSKVNIEISSICNLQCSFCPEVVREKKTIDVDLFRSIIEQVAPLTDQVCFHLMGDPLVHPKLAELVEICSAKQVPIFLVTNGVLLRPDKAAILLHPAFRQVNFSLHSFFDNFPDADPTSYLEKIFAFTDEALSKRPDLYLNYRLWNLKEPRGAGEKNKRILEAVRSRYSSDFNESSVDVQKNKSIKLKQRLYLHFDTEFTWPSLDLPMLGSNGTCYGLSSHFGILVDGTVVPCCLDKEGDIALGNVKEASIESILASTRAQAILDGFKRRKLVESLCQRCQYIERFQGQASEKEKSRTRIAGPASIQI